MAMKYEDRIKLFNELEEKSKTEQLTVREKMQLSRLRFVLNNPDLEKEKAVKRANKLQKLKEENPEEYNKIIEKRIKTIKKTNSKKTKEERRNQTLKAQEKRLEKGFYKETKLKMSKSAKKYYQENKDDYLKRYDTRKATVNNKPNEEKRLIKLKQSNSRLNSIKAKNSYEDSERNEKISKKLTGRKRSELSIARQKKTTTGRKMAGDRLLKQQQVIKNIFEKYGNPGLKIKKFKVNGITCQGNFEKAYLDSLIKQGKQLPKEQKSYYETPYGYYHPDFEFDDNLIEIKSQYTFR